MRTLFIDMASHHGCLAAVSERHTLGVVHIDHRIDDAQIIPLLDRLLANVAWKNNEIERVACVTGPGGFTSIRVGVTLANTIADQLNTDIAGIHLSDLSAVRARAQQVDDGIKTASPFFWVHSTKSTSLFVREFFSAAPTWPEPTLMSIAEFAAACPAGISWCGELLPAHEQALAQKNIVRAPLHSVEHVLPGVLHEAHFAKKPIEPWYGRGW